MNTFVNPKFPLGLMMLLLLPGLLPAQDLRPIYHIAPDAGWLGDPCGLFYYQGLYHVSYQHTPNSTTADFGNMHWGHAVSSDLVHWTNQPDILAPDNFGSCWDGSTVVDWNNSAGLGSNTRITIYTAAGNPFVQNLAFSTDSQTWTKYGGNPVLPNVVPGNHDPNVSWYAPGNKWVMALYLSGNNYGIFSSTDLIHWNQTSTFTFPGVVEVPQLFQLPLDGNKNNMKWLFYAGAGHYYVGQFDGNSFTAQYGPYGIRNGNSFAAGQIFSDLPSYDGRTILIANGTQNYPSQPFQSALDFPVEFSLVTSSSGVPTLYVNPVRELALLRTSTESWPGQLITAGVNLLTNTTGTAYELDVNFRPGADTQTTFTLGGLPITYNSANNQLSAAGYVTTLAPVFGAINLQILVDIGTVEIFGNNGQAYMPMTVAAVSGPQPLSMVASGPGGHLLSMQMHILSSQELYPGTFARWTMASTGANSPAVQDIITTDGAQNLWTFNGLANTYPTNSSVPPATMFANGNSGGACSFNASAFTNVDAALFYPQDIYGDAFDFTNSFTIELFFKSDGDQSQAGRMELLMQGENVFRYGLVINEAGPGAVRFALNDGQDNFPMADLLARNYADGTWHYLRASYDRTAAPNGRLTLTIANQNGTVDTTNLDIGTFDGLPSGNDGNLFIGRYQYSVAGDPRTFLGSINQVQITSGLLPGIKRLGALPSDSLSLSRWNMEPFQANTPAVLDQLRGQDLWAFNGLNNAFVTSTNIPPPTMYANGNNSCIFSYNAEAVTNVDGALFYPQDIYGNIFAFTNSFSVELFFKTDGNQSGAGPMELLMQGEQNFRYGVDLNEAGPGDLRLAVEDGQGNIPVADLSTRNYADGAWHYLLAAFEPGMGTNGALKLIVANQDGTVDTVVSNIMGSFSGLPLGNDGNLFVGRYRYPISGDHRTFRGLINEVQLSAPGVTGTQRLGNLPAPPMPQLSGTTWTTQGFNFSWNGVLWAGYDVQYATNLLGPWSVVASTSGAGSTATWQETNLTRLANSAGFYRISAY